MQRSGVAVGGMLVVALLSPVAASSEGTMQVQPGAGPPGTRIVITGDGCVAPAGFPDGTIVAVGLGAPGIEDVAGAAAYSDGGHSDPTYSPDGTQPASTFPPDVTWLRDDGTWSVPLWVPYGTPPGDYVLRARCEAYDYPDDPEPPPDVWQLVYEPQPFVVSTWPAVPPTFTPYPPSGLLLDGTGARHPWGWPTVPLTGGGGWWSQADLARGVGFAAIQDLGFSDSHPEGGGVVVDAFGGLHRIAEPAFGAGLGAPRGGPYWPGWDIARGVAVGRITVGGLAADVGAAGLVLDGWGGLHPVTFGDALQWTVTPGTSTYWPGWDIARDVAVQPGGGGGYVLDAWGGLHPFGLDGQAGPPKPAWQQYWKGWDIARGVVFIDDRSGYVFDAWGGAHAFSVDGAYKPATPPTPYWPGGDVVRGAALVRAIPVIG